MPLRDEISGAWERTFRRIGAPMRADPPPAATSQQVPATPVILFTAVQPTPSRAEISAAWERVYKRMGIPMRADPPPAATGSTSAPSWDRVLARIQARLNC